MRTSGCLKLAVALVPFGLYGQTAVPDSVKVFHAAGPMPSYEVATIKRPDENKMPAAYAAGGGGTARATMRGSTIRRYIQTAYGIPISSTARVIGGPAWIGSDAYEIQGNAPDEIRDAMQKMAPADRLNETRMMQQTLLQERLKLKVHFEMREMPVFEMVPAKSGLKMKEVPPPPSGPVPSRGAGGPLPPGTSSLGMGNGLMTITATATTMPAFISLLANQEDLGGRPIIDKTGFTGNFDVVGMVWAPSRMPPGSPFGFGGMASPDPGGASLFTALEEELGIKLVRGMASVEVVVIDSIERPTEN